MSPRIVRTAFLAVAMAFAAGCATLPPGGAPGALPAWTPGTPLDPAVEARILALDPNRVTESDVRETLARGPTPRVVLIHGGVYGVELLMESFAGFLIAMGYPADKIRGADGAYSISPYGDAARQAGEIAWYYENGGGARPMMIGHSQGGIQAVKLLHALAGWLDPVIAVTDPRTGERLNRTTVTDPLTGAVRPVVGLEFSYVSVIGTGGWSLALPIHWNVAPRIREIPDSVVSFTGYRIGWDILAMDGPGFEWLKTFSPAGRAEVRNVTLPAVYNHVFVPATAGLAEDPAARAWVDAFAPKGEDVGDDPPQFAGRNAVYAADNWWNVKKHWTLEAQRVIRERRRHAASAPPAPPAAR